MSYFPLTDSYAVPALTAPVVERVLVNEGEAGLYLTELKRKLAINATTTDYDDSLRDLLATAIGMVEVYCGLSVQPTSITARYSGYDGSGLPYGPVWATDPAPVVTATVTGSTVSISSSTTSAVSEGDFPTLGGSFSAGKVVYTAGYSHAADSFRPVPSVLIGAILEHAASSFRTGGMSGGDPGTYWKVLAGPMRRFD